VFLCWYVKHRNPMWFIVVCVVSVHPLSKAVCMLKGCLVGYRDENCPTVLEEHFTISVWETIEKGFKMHQRRIFKVQLTQGKRMSLSQCWRFFLSFLSVCS